MEKYLIAEKAAEFIYGKIKDYFGKEMGTVQHRDGGLFISGIEDGKMMSCFWHPSRKHSATCLHGEKVVQQAISDPGYWAIAYAKCRWYGGNKCMYNDEVK